MDFGKKTGTEPLANSCSWLWVWMDARFQVKTNGATPYQDAFGSTYSSELLPFGELVLFHIPVGSTDSNRIETHWKSSWKGRATPPSDNACSGSQVHQGNNQRWWAQACKTLSSAVNVRQLVFCFNTKGKMYTVEHFNMFDL